MPCTRADTMKCTTEPFEEFAKVIRCSVERVDSRERDIPERKDSTQRPHSVVALGREIESIMEDNKRTAG